MPCTDGEPRYLDSSELRDATTTACELLKALRMNCTGINFQYTFSATALEWIKAHDLEDQKRRDREKRMREDSDTRARALAKLSMYERGVLGL